MYYEPPKVEDYNITNADHKPELSIIMPGIHSHNWTQIYNSILASTRRTFELIIVTNGESAVPIWLIQAPNVKVIYDFGSPVRAHCIGASMAEGKLISWIPDDGKFIPAGLDYAIDKLYEMGNNNKNIVTYKFTENEKVYTDEYYKINFHKGALDEGIASDYIPDDYYILNHCVMYCEYYEELGGFDCLYEGTAMAYIDFSIRAQYDNAIVHLLEGMPILICTQLEAEAPTHSAIHEAQMLHDEPLYDSIYKQPNWQEKIQVKLDHSSAWKKSPIAWPRKYKNWVYAGKFAYAHIDEEEIIRRHHEHLLKVATDYKNKNTQGIE